MEQIREASKFFFTNECIDEYFSELNFYHVDCLKTTISKALGITIIGGSLLVKVPQVVKIYKNRSSDGINLYSVFLDLFAITSMASYSYTNGFPFSAWGDSISLGIQTLIIAILSMHCNGDTFKAISFLVGYLVIVSAVVGDLVPLNLLWTFQTLNIPIVLISKMFQAHTNYKNGSTGQLSAITVLMLLFGSVARIFTSLQETNDISMIALYVCSTTANAIICTQLFYYWNNGTKKQKKSTKMK